ncbi:hypothetical protein ACFL1Y_01070 [Patescibacteria group bacterium]
MNKKIFIPVILLIAVMLAVPLASKALVAKSGDTVSVDEIVEGNFFGAGNMVTIAGVVNGDIFVAGNNITITGTVNGDVFAAGSSIEISGDVNGNLRLAGSTINIRGEIERNVLAAGANLIFSESASVGQHITFAGASLIINSPVGGQIDATGGSVILNNEVMGDVKLDLEEEGSLTLMSKAHLNGDLNYKAIKEAEIKEGAQILGTTNYEVWEKRIIEAKDEKALGIFKVGFVIAKLINLASLFIIGLLLILMVPKPMKRMYTMMKENFWSSTGTGLVILIVTPIVCFILLFTVIGIPIAVISFLVYGILLYIAKAIAGLAVGKWITEKIKWHVHDVISLLIGLIVLTLIMWIPVVGWALGFILFLWAVGGWYQIKKAYIKEMK